MKNLIYILLFSFLFLSCKMKSEKESSSQPLTKELTKLEKLFLLPYDSVMVYYDLSNDNIENFPNLSAFTIKSLDLSHNLLDTINPLFLPKGLEKLNLSHNLYCGFILIRKNTIPYLKELDMSHNALNRIDISPPLYRINVSYNDLAIIDLNHKNIQYLDISYNSNMSERVTFNPAKIDTIVREGVADGKRLLAPNAPPLPHPTFISE
ncbi:hypothetical protein [Bacteroides caecimuris]|uniref:hypothetical protein n=3 Tax=Bacteroides caecimuris TaxID=1796613 RepID=UPI0026599550|nr:hypothetical protein [Bacteroides caecimuris]